MNRQSFRAGRVAAFTAIACCLLGAGSLSAQTNSTGNNGQRITPQFKDAEIGMIVGGNFARVMKAVLPA
jgi:hypothetical protein